MGDTVEDLRRQLNELESRVSRIEQRSRGRQEVGSPRNPTNALYVLDPDTGAVAKVVYDRSSSALTTEEV